MGLKRQMEAFRAQDKGATALLSPKSGIKQGRVWGGGELLLRELGFPQRGRQGRREAVGEHTAVRTF